MRENILLGPASEVERRARWKEVETGLGELGPLLARQALVEPAAQDFERDCELLTKEAEVVMRRGAERLLAEVGGKLECAQILKTVLADSFAKVTVRVRSVNIEGNRARAEAVLKPEGELSTFRTILLEQDDGGGWLISDFG